MPLQLSDTYLAKCWSQVTIEPALVICYVVSTISGLGNHNLYLQKLCYQNDTGSRLGEICRREDDIQEESIFVQGYKTFLEILFKSLILIISSNWKSSRRPYFVLPLCGFIIVDFMNLFSTYFWQSSVWILGTGVGVVSGITGAFTLLGVGTTLYASDNTTHAQRTLRIGIYEAIYACTAPIGDILSGPLLDKMGFANIFLMSICGNTIACLIILKTIKDNHEQTRVQIPENARGCQNRKTLVDQKRHAQSTTKLACAEQPSNNKKDALRHCSENQDVSTKSTNDEQTNDHKFLEVSPANRNTVTNEFQNKPGSLNPFKICVDNFRILLKARDGGRTTITLLVLFSSMMLCASVKGEYTVLYNYLRRQFQWKETEYGIYVACRAWSCTFGILFSIGILARFFHLKDTTIGFLACVSNLLTNSGYLFVESSLLMYMLPLVDVFFGSGFVVASSIVSKEIQDSELPNILAVKSLMETLFPLLTTPLYTLVYYHNVYSNWHSIVFILGVILTVPAFIGFGAVEYLQRRRRATIPKGGANGLEVTVEAEVANDLQQSEVISQKYSF